MAVIGGYAGVLSVFRGHLMEYLDILCIRHDKFLLKLRMNGGDYSQPGWYFLTLGADYHSHLFGQVVGCEMRPNELGQLVEECWREIPRHYDHVALGAWQVMPNHFHGLLRIIRPGGAQLGEVINMFKGSVTRK